MSPQKPFKLTLLLLIIINCTNSASANFIQKMLPVNKLNKKVTFTFYHFNKSNKPAIKNVSSNLGETAKKNNSKAAISASSAPKLTFRSGKFFFPSTTPLLIKNGTPASNHNKSSRSSKHTLILTNNIDQHAICYSPSIKLNELTYALTKYIAYNKANFTTAIIIDSGNNCGFYKPNGKYRPYYLKELKKPQKALLLN